MRCPPPFQSLLRRFRTSERGNVILIFALAVPVLAVGGCGAIDMSSLWSDKSALQDAVDNAALDAAKQIGVTSAAGISSRADNMVKSAIPEVYARLSTVVTATVAADGSSVTVSGSGHRLSFFGNLLPPGGWKIKASATAEPSAAIPLCVLHIETVSSSPLKMQSSASVTASACKVESNSGIVNGGTGWLKAADVQSVGSASGNISPAAETGAPVLPDPFASSSFSMPTSCSGSKQVYFWGTVNIPAGVHCGGIQLMGSAQGLLAAGDHIFVGGDLLVQQNATLSGSDVALAFSGSTKFKFVGSSSVDLEGRHSGPYAGFLIVTDRTNGNVFTIQSKNVTKLYGTIYMPAGTLSVSGLGGGQVAKQSAWTVIVAKQVQVLGSQELVINSTYSGSAVPVPNGVGPSSIGKVRLAH